MFEAVELGRKVSREAFEAQVPELRARLIAAQQAARQAGLPVLIVISGVDGAGKGEVIHRLNEWLDPRGIDTHSWWKLTDEERERPYYWRYWRALPARGRSAIFFGAWYGDLLQARLEGERKAADLESELSRIAALERMLAEDGVLIVKFWFHLSRKAQRRRFKEHRKHPDEKRVMLPDDRKRLKQYDALVSTAEAMIRKTDTGLAPWRLVECTQDRYRDLTTGQLLLEAIEARLQQAAAPARPRRVSARERRPGITVLDRVDLTQSIEKRDYERALEELQVQVNRWTWDAYRKRVSSVLVFEGWDAAGKGSAIRRLTEAIDARLFRVVPVAAPTEEERAHHYLWRFWRQLPRAGMVTIFDRSWYGRVLVERVEGFATREAWHRAYHEINEFERQLVDHGTLLCKFWIHISKAEQMQRFRKRAAVAHKQYKITPEDWRNRRQWGDYERAVHDMVSRTSTAAAPWTLVPGNDKRFARLEIVRTFAEALKAAV